jgi:multidrug efflux pump subunit AcrA (membrane-fusion protein)
VRFGLIVLAASVVVSCGNTEKVHARDPGASGSTEVSVGIVKIGKKPLARTLTLSSELVPFQEIDIYAKESGYIKDLPVDYGTHVQ